MVQISDATSATPGASNPEAARPPVAEAVTSVGQGPSRDGEAARPPVAEAATSVGRGPHRDAEAARAPVADAATSVGQGPLVLLSAAICVFCYPVIHAEMSGV